MIQNACEVLPKDPMQKYSFVFVFPSAQEKRDWVKEIKLLVREFQKKEAQARREALARKGMPALVEFNLTVKKSDQSRR